MAASTMRSGFRYTNATADEIRASSPADELMPNAAERWVRCITIRAPHPVVYRWLCQLTVAPYSFDSIDFPGRQSPEQLTPGADQLHIGQPFLIFAISSFKENTFIAGMARPEFEHRYGRLAVSYAVRPLTTDTTRIQANLCVPPSLPRFRRWALAVGDSIMAGRQLVRLRNLAERTYREQR